MNCKTKKYVFYSNRTYPGFFFACQQVLKEALSLLRQPTQISQITLFFEAPCRKRLFCLYFFSSGSKSPKGKHRLQRKCTPEASRTRAAIFTSTIPASTFHFIQGGVKPFRASHILRICLQMTCSTRSMFSILSLSIFPGPRF